MFLGLSVRVACLSFDLLIRFFFSFEELPAVNCQPLSFLAVALSLRFQMARPYYDGLRNTTPNPHCSALSVFPRQQSPTIWKVLIPQFHSFSSNGFLLCPFPHLIFFFISLTSFLNFFMLQFDLLSFSLSFVVAPFSCAFHFKYLLYYHTLHLLSFVLFLSSRGHFFSPPSLLCVFLFILQFSFNMSTLNYAPSHIHSHS